MIILEINVLFSAVPGKPVGPVKFSQILADSVTLSWSPPKKDGGSKITGYAVELSSDGGKTWSAVDTVDAKTTSLVAKGLKEGQKYLFRVAAVNSVGKGDYLESDAVTPQRQISELHFTMINSYKLTVSFLYFTFIE